MLHGLLSYQIHKGKNGMMSSLPKLGYRISSGTNTSSFSQWLRKEAESISQITWGCSVSLANLSKESFQVQEYLQCARETAGYFTDKISQNFPRRAYGCLHFLTEKTEAGPNCPNAAQGHPTGLNLTPKLSSPLPPWFHNRKKNVLNTSPSPVILWVRAFL